MDRSPNGINVHRFLEGFGVKVLPYHMKRDPRPANTVYGGREVGRLMRKDLDRAGLVIRCIQASNPICFDDIYLWSVWRFLVVHLPQAKPRDATEAFAGIDVAQIRKRVHTLGIGDGGALGKSTVLLSYELAREILEGKKAA